MSYLWFTWWRINKQPSVKHSKTSSFYCVPELLIWSEQAGFSLLFPDKAVKYKYRTYYDTSGTTEATKAKAFGQ